MVEKQQSKAQKLLLEYRPTIWRKSALEAVPDTGQKALQACIERMNFTQELVSLLQNDKLLGKKMYQIISATYMTERHLGSVDEILDHLAKNHECIPRRTYFRLRGRAISILDNHLEELAGDNLLSSG